MARANACACSDTTQKSSETSPLTSSHASLRPRLASPPDRSLDLPTLSATVCPTTDCIAEIA